MGDVGGRLLERFRESKYSTLRRVDSTALDGLSASPAAITTNADPAAVLHGYIKRMRNPQVGAGMND